MDYNDKPDAAVEALNDKDDIDAATSSVEAEDRKPRAQHVDNAPQSAKAPASPRQPRLDLLEYQLCGVAHDPSVCGETATRLRKATIDTYQSLSPRGGLESITARNVVGLNNLSMRLMGQAGTNPGREELRLKHVARIVQTLGELVTLHAKLRDGKDSKDRESAGTTEQPRKRRNSRES